MLLQVNAETEIFFYPGVDMVDRQLKVDPVIGVENRSLRRALANRHEALRINSRVCHAYLGLLDAWGHFYVKPTAPHDDLVQQIVKSVETVGLPAMMAFDSVEKVMALLKASIEGNGPPVVAMMFEAEKLAALEECYSANPT